MRHISSLIVTFILYYSKCFLKQTCIFFRFIYIEQTRWAIINIYNYSQISINFWISKKLKYFFEVKQIKNSDIHKITSNFQILKI